MNLRGVLALACLLMATLPGLTQVPEPLAQKWRSSFANALLSEVPTAIAMDSAGNVYVAGFTELTTGFKGTVLKFGGGNGALLWRWESPALIPLYRYFPGADSRARLAISPDGDPVAVFEEANELVKLHAVDGSVNWLVPSRSHGQPDFVRYDLAIDLTIDGSGDILTVGTGKEGCVGKFRGSDGQLIWLHQPASAVSSRMSAVQTDLAGNVFITGIAWMGSTAVPSQTYTAKLSGTTGAALWSRIEPGPSPYSQSTGWLLKIDPGGDVVIATYEGRLLKYRGNDGGPIWTRFLGTQPSDLITDSAGDVYVAVGKLVKIDGSSGSTLWQTAAYTQSTKTILIRNNELIALGSEDYRLFLKAFAVQTGQPRWVLGTAYYVYGSVYRKPLILLAQRPDGNIAITGPAYGGGVATDIAAAVYGPGPLVGGAWVNWVLQTKARVRVNAAGNGRPGNLYCEYGRTTAYGEATPVQSITSTTDQQGAYYTVMLEGLEENTLYHARAVAITDRGTTTSADFTFTTGWDANKNALPDEWEITHWGTPIVQITLDDEDRDGLTSLMEYALGTNPRRHDSAGALPIVLDADERLSVTVPKRPNVTLRAEVSSDLKTWSPGEVSREDEATITLRDLVPKASAPSRFLRVRAISE